MTSSWPPRPRPSAAAESSEPRAGAGLWIARQLTSRLEMRSSADGLTAWLWI
jgi:hypothetical protein